MRLHGQLALEPAGAEDLDLHALVDEPGLQQDVHVDLRPVGKPAELGEVDDRELPVERVLEARQLGDALCERHLAALETDAEAFAARVLSFLSATRRLAPPGAGAATDSIGPAVCALRRLEVVQLHATYPSDASCSSGSARSCTCCASDARTVHLRPRPGS